MTKKILYLSLMVSLLLFLTASAANINQINIGKASKTAPMKNSSIFSGKETILNSNYAPTIPHLAAGSPGDTVGVTQWDFQSNGAMPNRIVLDNAGGVHLNWIQGDLPYPPGPRYAYYNFITSTGGQAWQGTGTNIAFGGHTTDGYPSISATPDNRAAIAYHNATVGDSLFYAEDSFQGVGIFTTFSKLMHPQTLDCLWPYVTVDRTNKVHVIATESNSSGTGAAAIGYMRSTNGGSSWTTPTAVDTTTSLSAIITSSPVSDKVAIIWTRATDTSSQWQNDVYYVQSTNGTTWDFRNGKHNITNYLGESDSLFAYADVDAVYDFNDNLHIIWNAQYIDTTTGGIYYNALLEHYDVTSGTIRTIAQFDSSWYSTGCDFPAWSFTIAKMSIGADITNNALFVAYTSWNVGDCSVGGFANGDIFMNYSTDGGATWTLKGNLTDSHTDSCEAGDCDHDHFSSIAEKVDDGLHLLYLNDKDAGSAVRTEGAVTDNALLYIDYPNPVRTSAVPVAPALVFPYNDSSYANGSFLFDWRDPVGVTSYVLQVDDDIAFGTPLFTLSGILNSEAINPDAIPVGSWYWRVKSVGYYGESAYSAPFHFIVTEAAPVCDYAVGDVNNNGTFNGIDVTYGVGYFKGGNPPPYSCECTPGNTWFVAGDVNGNCSFNGIDITYMVSYFKGGAAPVPCPSCAPAR
jgi:hypothetical protein